MTHLAVLVLTVFGLTYLVGQSVISLPFRAALASLNRAPVTFFLSLIECPSCLSFHVGWVATACGAAMPFERSALGAIATGCFFSGTSYLLARATGISSNPSLPEALQQLTHALDKGEHGDGTRHV